MSFRFEIEARDGKARAGRMVTPHGVVQTPVFLPVGTLGTVKAVAQDVLEELGAQIQLDAFDSRRAIFCGGRSIRPAPTPRPNPAQNI